MIKLWFTFGTSVFWAEVRGDLLIALVTSLQDSPQCPLCHGVRKMTTLKDVGTRFMPEHHGEIIHGRDCPMVTECFGRGYKTNFSPPEGEFKKKGG